MSACQPGMPDSGSGRSSCGSLSRSPARIAAAIVVPAHLQLRVVPSRRPAPCRPAVRRVQARAPARHGRTRGRSMRPSATRRVRARTGRASRAHPTMRARPDRAVATTTPPSSKCVSAHCARVRCFGADQRDLSDLARVQRRFQRRIAQPDQRIEQIVPVAFARGDVAAFGDARLVVQTVAEQLRRLRDETRQRIFCNILHFVAQRIESATDGHCGALSSAQTRSSPPAAVARIPPDRPPRVPGRQNAS